MGAMGFGERFSFALERDDVGACRWNRLGWNDRLELVFRNETGRKWLAVQHDAMERPHAALPSYLQCRGAGALDEKERRYFEV